MKLILTIDLTNWLCRCQNPQPNKSKMTDIIKTNSRSKGNTLLPISRSFVNSRLPDFEECIKIQNVDDLLETQVHMRTLRMKANYKCYALQDSDIDLRLIIIVAYLQMIYLKTKYDIKIDEDLLSEMKVLCNQAKHEWSLDMFKVFRDAFPDNRKIGAEIIYGPILAMEQISHYDVLIQKVKKDHDHFEQVIKVTSDILLQHRHYRSIYLRYYPWCREVKYFGQLTVLMKQMKLTPNTTFYNNTILNNEHNKHKHGEYGIGGRGRFANTKPVKYKRRLHCNRDVTTVLKKTVFSFNGQPTNNYR